jgi:hypothetical protein
MTRNKSNKRVEKKKTSRSLNVAEEVAVQPAQRDNDGLDCGQWLI